MKPSARRKARRFALQGIYQWQLAGSPIGEIAQQFLDNNNVQKVDVEYFQELLRGVVTYVADIDECMLPILDRRIDELNPVELAVLRVAIYELLHRIDVPYRVVINEALELTKIFGAVEGFKYVNGVLDQVARKIRATETQARQKRS